MRVHGPTCAPVLIQFSSVSAQACVTYPCPVACAERLAWCGAGCLVLAGLTTYFLFPETSGIPVEQTHTVFKDHWAWPRLYPEILQVSPV